MTSKEALKRIKKSHRIAMACLGIDKPDIETEKAIDIIEKDLEVLEILKKYHNKDSLLKTLINIYNSKELNKIKEWLEND